MAIQQNFPSSRPSLSLNFARSKKLDPRITFTRTSSATYVGEDGLIKYAGVNEARFDHDPITGDSLGLLVEEARTNLALRSEEFDDASWDSAAGARTVTANQITAPNGTTTADLVTADGTNGFHFVSQAFTLSAVPYSFSVFVKAGTESVVILRTFNAFGNVNAVFNLSTGTLTNNTAGTTARIVAYANGWYRCILDFTPLAATSSIGIYLSSISQNTASTDLYIWGAQLEAGAFPTSYIPTTTATVTRTADNASMTGSNFSSWFNPNEGSIFIKYKINALIEFISGVTNNSTHYIFMDDLSTEVSSFNKIQQFSSIASTQNRLQVDGVNYSPAGFGPLPANTTNISGMAYKLGTSQVAAYLNNNISFITAPSMPNNLSELRIGTSNQTVDRLNGTISYFTYYPSRLTNTQLITLTK